jgi:DNA polymerase III delta subunit
MLSKIVAWDFLPKMPKMIDPKKPGLYAFLIPDPYLEQIVLSHLPKKEMQFSLYSGVDVSRDFIDEHLVNLSFFSNIDHIQVMNAENIPAASIKHLLESNLDWSERFMVLLFTKTNKSFTELSKDKSVHGFEIEEPKFWEGAKLWQFCLKQRNLTVTPDITKIVLEHMEHTFESFLWVIDTIKTYHPDGLVTVDEIKNYIKKERWDFFELAELFNNKPQLFFQEILKKETDYDWLRAMCAFMQTHLTKILFPEDIRKKGKLSRYDSAILEISESWNRSEVLRYLKLFSELEILAKSSDQQVIERIRLELVNLAIR